MFPCKDDGRLDAPNTCELACEPTEAERDSWRVGLNDCDPRCGGGAWVCAGAGAGDGA